MYKWTNEFITRSDLEPELIPPTQSTSKEKNGKPNSFVFMRKNRKQSNCVAPGLLVLGAGGYHIAWLLWNVTKPEHSTATLFVQFSCWYFGNIAGSLLGAVIVPKWQKRNVYYFCSSLTTLGGVICIVWFNVTWLFAVTRLICGFAHGIAYITTITHGAENVVKEMRGRLISSTHIMIYSSFCAVSLAAMFSYALPEGLQVEQLVGIWTTGFGAMGILFTPFYVYESVTYLLYRNKDRQALEDMIELRSESVVTWDIRTDLDEMKLMVTEDRVRSGNITKDGNMRPLLLMVATMVMVAISSNLILNRKLLELTTKSFMDNRNINDPDTPNDMSIAAMILVTCRYLPGYVMPTIGDSFRRKRFLLPTTVLSALCLLLANVLSPYSSDFTNGVNVIPGLFAVAFQIFVGVGIEPIHHVFLSEAFSTAKKYWSIAYVAAVDSLVQIAIISLSFIDDGLFVAIFIYCSIVIFALITVILHTKLPETRGISLRHARDQFTKATGLPEGITYS